MVKTSTKINNDLPLTHCEPKFCYKKCFFHVNYWSWSVLIKEGDSTNKKSFILVSRPDDALVINY